jgi:hypothetical protein
MENKTTIKGQKLPLVARALVFALGKVVIPGLKDTKQIGNCSGKD